MALDVEDLRVSFATRSGWLRAVDGVSFSVGSGETLVIVGESGCGKSATVRSLMGLAKGAHVTGTARLGAVDLLDPRASSRVRGSRISMVFQDPMTTLNPVLRIGEQLAETMVHHRVAGRVAARRRSLDLLDEVRIRDPRRVARSYPHQLSGGMRQRVVIAMALACGPEIILADEPTTALDVTVQAQILDLLLTVQQRHSTGLVLITHDMGIARVTATKVIVMYAGQVVESGTAAQVLQSPGHPYTAALMQCLPRMHGPDPRHRRLRTITGSPPNLATEPEGCRFAARCPLGAVGDRCFDAREPIALRELAEGHLVRTLHGQDDD